MCQRVWARVGGRLQRCAAPPKKSTKALGASCDGIEIRSNDAHRLQAYNNYCKAFFYAHDFAVPTHIGSLSLSELLIPIAVADSDASGWPRTAAFCEPVLLMVGSGQYHTVIWTLEWYVSLSTS